MNRVQFMTLGLVLAFIGGQLYFVESYVLTPQVTKIVGQSKEKTAADAYGGFQDAYQNPQDYYQNFQPASYSSSQTTDSWKPRKNLSHPRWICWPVFFLGAVFFLHGVALRASGGTDS